MIAQNEGYVESSWQNDLKNGIGDLDALCSVLHLSKQQLGFSKTAHHTFPLRVPRGFVARMQKGDPQDPLLKQILPIDAETKMVAGYGFDPLQEQSKNPLPGLLHKYEGRVLLTVSGACPIHCRYCFRRHFPYNANNPGKSGWEDVLAIIDKDKSIGEVIYSGGEPLLASDKTLSALTKKIAKMPHVTKLRVHTRMPVVLPARITAGCVKALSDSKLKTVIVIHCNHPNELDENVRRALKKFSTAGAILLNQAVLLKGINDDANTLMVLNERLLQAGVLPYYLHCLDKVAGTHHFNVPVSKAKKIMHGLMEISPGYLVPKLVEEVAGRPYKDPISLK